MKRELRAKLRGLRGPGISLREVADLIESIIYWSDSLIDQTAALANLCERLRIQHGTDVRRGRNRLGRPYRCGVCNELGHNARSHRSPESNRPSSAKPSRRQARS